jgi:hypothetical protein
LNMKNMLRNESTKRLHINLGIVVDATMVP